MNTMKTMVLMVTLVLLLSGCYRRWEPSDTEAVDLVESHYLFYYTGKEIDAEIIARGKYIRKCKCFPVKFKIRDQAQGSYEKTFYFFKNADGTVEISEYQIDR